MPRRDLTRPQFAETKAQRDEMLKVLELIEANGVDESPKYIWEATLAAIARATGEG